MKDHPLTAFTDLGLSEPLLKALNEESYTQPTPIQCKAIPGVLAGRDLLGIAQTGTGKTAAFALPMLQRLAADRRPAMRKGCRALILSPTRELATQIAESFRTYGRHMGLTVTVIFGGVGHRPQINAMAKGIDVLVATPGRLLDHMDQRNVTIEGTEIFVLDEADQMLDLGFVKPIRQIVRHLSQRRQSLFFSATMPSEIGKLADELLRDPLKVAVAPGATTVERVAQRIILVEQTRKRSLLVELLADAAMHRTLIFTRTKRGADKVAKYLETAGISVAAIHGNKSQNQREQALDAFRAGGIRVLVATDIAARGIDVDGVTHVVNFELPDVPESYVHRIGRTARAGAAGVAIALVDNEERTQLRDIERITRQQIQAEDRRNDKTLTADAPAARGERRDSRGGDRGRTGQNRSAGGRSSSRAPGSASRGFAPRDGERRGDGNRGSAPRRDGDRSENVRSSDFRGGDFRDSERREPSRGGERRPEPRSAETRGDSRGSTQSRGSAPARRDEARPERRDDRPRSAAPGARRDGAATASAPREQRRPGGPSRHQGR